MRKFVLFIIIGMLFIGNIHILASSEEPQLEHEYIIDFHELKQIDKKEYISIELAGTEDYFVQEDYYVVPTKVETYTYPVGTNINSVLIEPRNIKESFLEKNLQIAPQARLTDSNKEESHVVSDLSNVQSISQWYSYDIGSGIIDGKRQIVLKIQLFPVQFHPYDNSIDWAESFSITVDFQLPDTDYQPQSNEESELIILAPSDFASELSSLVTHKTNRGISTKLVTLSDIYNGIYFPSQGRDNQEKVKYFIKNAIEQWNTRYVLLVGGYDDFPTRYTHVYVNYGSGDAEVFTTDLYYADVFDENGFCSWDSNDNDVFGEYDWGDDHLYDDIDIIPDVYLGRLACFTENQVTTVVNKIIEYENAESYKKDWFSNILLCGGDTFPGDAQAVDEGEYICNVVSDFMTGFSSTKKYVTMGELRTTNDISDGLNDGAGFFLLAGHANPTSWSTHPHENENVWIPTTGFRNTHAATLTNDEKLPILLTESCSPFKFASREDCLGWNFVSNPNGGVIAGFGCTGLSWGSDGTSSVTSLTAKLLIDTFKAYKNKGAITPGEMWVVGIETYYRPSLDGGGHKSVEEWQLLGDPSLAIAEDSLPPNKPSAPNGPSSGKAGETYSYTASTQDPEGDDIYYLFDWGDGTDSGWIGPFNSDQSCEAEYSWSSDGSYEVRVKAQDYHGVVSDWSDSLTVSMPKVRYSEYPFIEFLLELFPVLKRII